MSFNDRTNGFKVRGLNADADRVAVQSTHETTWLLGKKKGFAGLFNWHEVGLAKNEIKVLRPYGGAPELELIPLGGPHGVLIVERASGGTRVVRNGQKIRVALARDESLVLKTEYWQAPRFTNSHNLD